MGTRIMRSRGLRLLTMLIIPVSLCSARLQVFLFLTAAIFLPRQAPWVIFSLYVMSFVAALVTALAFKGRFRSDEPFVLELPPYRLPTLRQIALRAWHEVRHFLRRATKFIVGGVILIWLLTNLPAGAVPGSADTFAGMLGRWFQPVLAPLGIDERLTVALIFGFVAKEVLIGAFAVIFGLEGQALAADLAGRMDWVQAYSFMLFTLIYTPCLSTIATLRAEARSSGAKALSTTPRSSGRMKTKPALTVVSTNAATITPMTRPAAARKLWPRVARTIARATTTSATIHERVANPRSTWATFTVSSSFCHGPAGL